MEYICYISRSKIDALHEQVESQPIGETLQKVTAETSRVTEVKAGASIAKIFQPFTAGITYGRKDTIQLERTLKAAYLEKLREVLLAIYVDQGDIPDLDALASIDASPSVYYFYEGDFTCPGLAPPVTGNSIATLVSSQPDFELRLDCSMHHFSESSESHPIHSGNSWFFSGAQTMRMAGVIVLLGREGTRLIGTPLYLALRTSGRPGNVL